MTRDHRVTPGLVHDIVDALERHGYYRGGDLHAGLIGDLAGIYEGTQDHPAITGPAAAPQREAGPAPRGPAARGIAVLSSGEVRTVIAALDDASVYKQNRAGMCTDCDDRSCDSCQWCLQMAGTYSLLAADLDDASQRWRAASCPSPEREAGQ